MLNVLLGLLFLTPTTNAITVEMARHLTRVKILESNTVSLRPGSIYDNITVFESILGVKPKFKYEFIDTGLGAAEPLYPMYQVGHQGSWLQLLPAFFSEKNRHIDHYTDVTTPEGCRVHSLYMLRNIDEFPKTLYAKEREEGFDMIVLRLEHFTRTTPNAECGRHRTNLPDKDFNIDRFLRQITKAQTFEDFPKKYIDRFEAKISAIQHITERRGARDLSRVDDEDLANNSLWYYPKGHAFDYGISESTELRKGLQLTPRDIVQPATAEMQTRFPLEKVLAKTDFEKILAFLQGQPIPGFDRSAEPGNDVLDINNRDLKYFYTSGLEMIPVENAVSDVSAQNRFQLVGFAVKPFESIDDSTEFKNLTPQVRLVYQLMNPMKLDQPLEQLYLHINFDVLDLNASENERKQKFESFLEDLQNLAAKKNSTEFLQKYTQTAPESASFSSSITGIWVFGQLTRDHSQKSLEPLRIVRNGVDVGYYSSSYDNDLFRSAIKNETNEARKQKLEEHMQLLTVTEYRDKKRMDAKNIRFNQVTCAQCHQLSGRDAVHMAFNDHLDSRIKDSAIASEFVFHEAKWQLDRGHAQVSSWLNQ